MLTTVPMTTRNASPQLLLASFHRHGLKNQVSVKETSQLGQQAKALIGAFPRRWEMTTGQGLGSGCAFPRNYRLQPQRA
jgi:hypothetical protein